MVQKILRIAAVLQVAFLVACGTLPYQDDNIGFFVSAQAGSTEFPVYINGHLCTDMEGFPGLCAKRVKSKESLDFHFDAQDYAYLLNIECTEGVSGVNPQNVPAGQAFTFTIKPEQFINFTQFTCNGKVNPQDRTAPIAGSFQVRVVVYDANYAKREDIHVAQVEDENGDPQNWIVLGQFARQAWVFDNGKWTRYDKKPQVQLEGDPAQAKAYSESYMMRFNYFNMSDADGGVK